MLAWLSVACGYDNGDRERVEDTETIEISSGSIDTDQTMTNLGDGIGVYVEYATGGIWKLQVSCDTAETDIDCYWDVVAATPIGVPITAFSALDLETSSDLATIKSDGELNLVTKTTTDLDGISFVTTPGEPVTFDLLLEDVSHPERYFYFISNGEVVEGADTPIIELTPTLD
jgi:hypothetical protein